MRRLASLLIAATLAVALVLTGAAAGRSTAGLNIYAAASLTEVFKAYDSSEQYNFAGSNVLETQIRQGAPADIFASAAPLNTQRLFAAGIVDKPVTFTANRLALIVSKSPDKAAAQAWIKGILSAKGQAALENAGFLPLPKTT